LNSFITLSSPGIELTSLAPILPKEAKASKNCPGS